MKEQPSYYAVIPSDVRYDPELRPNEKLMYGEISALSSAEGVCWASNSYFAKLYGVSNQAVSKWIKNLASRGYITVEYSTRAGSNVKRRFIRLTINHRLMTINHRLRDYQPQVEHNNKKNNKKNNKIHNFTERDYSSADYEEIERMMT